MLVKSISLKLEHWIHSVSKHLNSVSSMVLLLMMVFITTDVVLRYIFKFPITGSIDFVIVMMVVFIFFSFPNTTYRRTHVRTDIVYERFSNRIKGILDFFSIGLSAFITFIIAWQIGARAWDIVQHPPGIATLYFRWPHLPFIILATICCFVMFLEMIIWFIESIRKSVDG